MMETAQARARNHRRLGRRLLLNWPAIRSVLVEGVVNPIFAIIADVISDQPPKMLFVERNHVVEYLSATRSHPAFGDTVLPGSLHAGLLWLQTRGFQEGDDFRVELRVAVQDDVTIRTSFGEGLTQLLDDPLRSRVSGNVEV